MSPVGVEAGAAPRRAARARARALDGPGPPGVRLVPLALALPGGPVAPAAAVVAHQVRQLRYGRPRLGRALRGAWGFWSAMRVVVPGVFDALKKKHGLAHMTASICYDLCSKVPPALAQANLGVECGRRACASVDTPSTHTAALILPPALTMSRTSAATPTAARDWCGRLRAAKQSFCKDCAKRAAQYAVQIQL